MKTISVFLFLFFSFFVIATESPSNNIVKKHFVLANRYYVSKILQEAFGPNSFKIIEDNILQKGSIFGGPCDIYEQIRIGKKKYENKADTLCFQGKQEFNFPIQKEPNTIREALMNKTCTTLTKNSTTLNFFINRLGYVNKLNEGTFEKIVGNFHWNESRKGQLIKGLKSIGEKYPDQNQKIKLLIFYSCIDPTWHLL